MPKRLRFYDLRNSRLPSELGLCAADIPQLCSYVNSAQMNLIYAEEAGDEGWWGTFAEIAFTVSRTSPYWTATRDIARLQAVNVCEAPYGVENQFLEYLQFGNGRLPKTVQACGPTITQVLTRNTVPTFVDLSSPPQYLRVYAADQADVQAGRRVFLQGTDSSDNIIYSIDTLNRVQGEFVSLANPFVSPVSQFNSITGIQKDITVGQIRIYQADPTTGDEVLLLTMEPTEDVASYRRYYFSKLPQTCCPPVSTSASTSQNLTVTAIAKLELIPVRGDTDYCLIQNPEAIIHECQSIRFASMDAPAALSMSTFHHKQAIKLLKGELAHYLGIDDPAIVFAPFGSARLEKQKIGTLI